MKTIFSSLIVILFFIICLGLADSRQASNNIRLPVKAKSLREKPNLVPDTLFAKFGNTQYRITTRGIISWGKKSIRLNTEAWVGKIYLDTIDKKYLLVFYEEDFATEGGASVEKFDLLARKSVWHKHIPGFNLGQPYIKNEFAYINAIGMVGKLNLRSGTYAYEFSDLYDRQKSAFNQFDSISFHNHLTYFISKNHRTKRLDTIIVDENSKNISIRK